MIKNKEVTFVYVAHSSLQIEKNEHKNEVTAWRYTTSGFLCEREYAGALTRIKYRKASSHQKSDEHKLQLILILSF